PPGDSQGALLDGVTGCVLPEGTTGTIRVEERSMMWPLGSVGVRAIINDPARRASQSGRTDPVQIPSDGPICWNAPSSKDHRHNTDERTSAHRRRCPEVPLSR